MAKHKIFFGTYSKGDGNGIFCGEFDGDNGEIKITDTLDIENPAYLQLNNNILYGVSEISDGELFAVNIADPAQMKLINVKSTHGKHPCHLCVKDNFVFAANYSEGSLSIFEISEDGGIKDSCQSIYHFGKSVNPGRQTQSHVHFADMTPDNKYLAVCDLGLDKVFLYPYCCDTGLSTKAKIIECPPGAGPRHLTFSKDGEYMYVLTELTNTVLAYRYNGGDAEFLQEISTLPKDFTGHSTCAAIHVSPDGRLLGASNRGHDSVAVFRIKNGGELGFETHIMTGKEPRDFNFSPDGRWLLAANQNEDSLTLYDIENDKFIDANIKVPKPVCILFGEEI